MQEVEFMVNSMNSNAFDSDAMIRRLQDMLSLTRSISRIGHTSEMGFDLNLLRDQTSKDQ
jgi:hypothetical protein